MNLELSPRERLALRWTILASPVIAVIVAAILVATVVHEFFNILTMFFLAWLLAFLIDPIVTWIVGRMPAMSRGPAAALVFVGTALLAISILVAIASSVVSSLSTVIGNASSFEDAVARLLAPLQAQIDALGFNIDLAAAARDGIGQIRQSAADLLGDVLNGGVVLFTQGTAIIFIAVVMVANKSRFLRFLERLVPSDRTELYREFVAATTRSFGGFIRGQFGLAGLYGVIVGVIGFVFGVPFVALVAVLTTILQSIPYFGQLVSWIPLVAVTFVFAPQVIVPVIVILSIGLLVIQNFVSPKVLGQAVGLNPILVLAAVFIGAQVAGGIGAIFGVPVLAVFASLFNAWLDQVRPEHPHGHGDDEQRPGDIAAAVSASSS